MGRLTCKCLNISIHTKAKPEPLDPSALRLPAGERDADFFKGQVAEIQLDLGGISEEQKCLIRRSSIGEWVVRTCTNCETDCYATHATKGMNRVLVSLSLVSDTEKQEELRRSPSFSPLFHVILHEISKTKSPTLGHPTTSNQDALKKTVGDLQDQLSRYLTKEKASMEERIKKFTEDQQAAYNSLQKKAYRDKNLMVGLMVEADEKSLEDSISEAMLETTLTPPHTPVSLSKNRVNSSLPPISMSYPRTFHGEIATAKEKPREVPVKAYGGPQRSGATPRGVAKTRHRSNDADTMFDLDGFNDDCDPFFESDDESSTDDNSLNDDHLTRTMSGRGTSSRAGQNFATSVPISMPVWNREAKLSLEDEDDDDDKVPMPEPDHMVASMKALSLSVQDGTEMFGDLPRPRLNTGDAISLSKKINL